MGMWGILVPIDCLPRCPLVQGTRETSPLGAVCSRSNFSRRGLCALVGVSSNGGYGNFPWTQPETESLVPSLGSQFGVGLLRNGRERIMLNDLRHRLVIGLSLVALIVLASAYFLVEPEKPFILSIGDERYHFPPWILPVYGRGKPNEMANLRAYSRPPGPDYPARGSFDEKWYADCSKACVPCSIDPPRSTTAPLQIYRRFLDGGDVTVTHEFRDEGLQTVRLKSPPKYQNVRTMIPHQVTLIVPLEVAKYPGFFATFNEARIRTYFKLNDNEYLGCGFFYKGYSKYRDVDWKFIFNQLSFFLTAARIDPATRRDSWSDIHHD